MTLTSVKLNSTALLRQAIISLVICLVAVTSFGARQKVSQSKKPNQKIIMSADQELKVVEPTPAAEFHAAFLMSRSTSLIDFKDGSRKDGLDVGIIPSVKLRFGSVSSKIIYSRDLRDDSPEASDLNDIPVTFAMNAMNWEWSNPYILTLTPTVTAVIPVARDTVKKDQLQTAISTGLSFGIIPDGIAPKRDGAWSLAIGVTAGRSFHPYQENVAGEVLNQYSSNQTLNLGYTYKDFSISAEYIHKARWTYKGNLKEAFELSQEIGYSINDNFGVALGHTNAGAGLKANGYESNLNLVNENSSTVYGQLAVSF